MVKAFVMSCIVPDCRVGSPQVFAAAIQRLGGLDGNRYEEAPSDPQRGEGSRIVRSRSSPHLSVPSPIHQCGTPLPQGRGAEQSEAETVFVPLKEALDRWFSAFRF